MNQAVIKGINCHSMNQAVIKGTKVPFNESSNDYLFMRDVN
jgi:hypothetical protein